MSILISQVLVYLADFGKFFQELKITEGNFSWIIILFFLFAIFLTAFTFGRSRLLLALISIYGAALIESRVFFLERLGTVFSKIPEPWLRVGFFLIIYLLMFIILDRSLIKHRLSLKEASFFSILSLAIAQFGLLISILLSYFPPELKLPAPESITLLFTDQSAKFFWAILPLIIVFFLRRGKEV